MNNKFTLDVCIPVYKGSQTLSEALICLLNQSYKDFKVYISDDNHPDDIAEIDNTQKILKEFKGLKIKYSKNRINLGSAKNINRLANITKGDIIFFLCQDDILSRHALSLTINAFKNNDVGVVTRPFFWFESNFHKPVRAIMPYNPSENSLLSVFDSEQAVRKIFESVGQISGLAYRRKYITSSFNAETFVGHIYPIAEMLKKYKCMYLKDYTVAVRIPTSQTRYKKNIYRLSPTRSWVDMFERVYYEDKFKRVKKAGIDQIVTHFEGLVQIKNFGTNKELRNEIINLFSYRWQNIFKIKFWFYTFITLSIPSTHLMWLTDNFKRHILAKTIKDTSFNLGLSEKTTF